MLDHAPPPLQSRWLGNVALLPWVAGIAILAVVLGMGSNIRQRASFSQTQSLIQADAAVGTKIELPRADAFSNVVSQRARTLLVYAGSCSGCTVNALDPARLEDAPYDQVVLVYWGSNGQVLSDFKHAIPKLRIVADPTGAIPLKLGAVSAPRFYVLEKGVLVDIWKDPLAWPKPWLGELKS